MAHRNTHAVYSAVQFFETHVKHGLLVKPSALVRKREGSYQQWSVCGATRLPWKRRAHANNFSFSTTASCSLTKPFPHSQGSGTLLSFLFCSPVCVTHIQCMCGRGRGQMNLWGWGIDNKISIDMQIISMQLLIFYMGALTTSLCKSTKQVVQFH